MIAEVIVDVAHSEVDKIFDYLCDDSVQAGCRVTVPFGRTYVAGFVMRIKPTSDFPNLKRIAKVFDELPAINPPVPNRAWTEMKRDLEINVLSDAEKRDLYLGKNGII